MWLMVATLSLLVVVSESNYPTFDITTSTLHIFLPADTRAGNIIYRIRATDQDKDYPLVFGATDYGNYVIRLETLPCYKNHSHCAANVYLKRTVAPRQKYTFRMTVTDTNGDTATKQVTLEVTDSTADINIVFPHIPGLIMVPEDTKIGEQLGYVIVRKNPRLSRPPSLELWKEANGSFLEKPFEFKLVQNSNKDTTTGYIVLDQPLDYEYKTMYRLSVYALDMYAVAGEDSRNIAGFELVIVVKDVQDTPPIWDHIDPITRLLANATEDAVVMKVTARDGDKGTPRSIKYGLVPEGNPFTTFFSIDQDTGEIHLVRPIKELRSISRAHQPILLTVVAEEIVNERQDPNMSSSTATVALLLDELQTSTPTFLSSNYVTSIKENSIQGTVLQFENQYKTQVDLGKHGVFALQLENNNGTFEINPIIGNQVVNFTIKVRDNNLLDYEETKSLSFKITAKEVNSDKKSEAISSSVDVTVFITDVNDNSPVFSHMKYTTKMSENVTKGTEVMRVLATDLDTGEAGVVRYTAIMGYLNSSFSLDPNNGVIVVNTNKHGFDREEKSEYHFQVEARDMGGVGNKGTVSLVFEITDVNDEIPTFVRNPMDIILAPGDKNFTEQIFIKAIDKDSEPPNNVVHYEIVSGNYNNKFAINAETGELTVKNVDNSRVSRQTSNSTTELMVRAYDLGIPTLWSTGQVRIYPYESGARILTFIVPGDKPDKRSVEEMLTVLTGGKVILQEIRPYKDGLQETAHDLAAGHPNNNKSVVVATVFYTNKYTELITEIATSSKPEYVAAAENRVLFWVLVVLLILIALALLTLLCCCLCACCPLYAIGRRKRRVQTAETMHYVTQNGERDHESKGVQAEWSGSDRKEAWSADTYTRRNWQFNRRNNIRRNEPRRVVLVAAPPSGNTIINGDAHNQGLPKSKPGVNVIYTRDIAQRPSDRIILEDFDGTEYRVLDPSRLSRTVRHEENPDTDSMRRHEYERGSDDGGALHEEQGMENAPRDQMFIREGNAEILRLITRGRVIEEEEPKLNQPDHPYTAQKVSEDIEKHEDNGKEILMKRFMEDQRGSTDKQSNAKEEEEQTVTQKVEHHFKDLKQDESKEQSEDLMKRIMNIPERNLSTGDVNRLTTLQRDLLLTRFLVEEQRRSFAHVAGHDDTQSLPGMTSSMATQTDVNRGTQTDILYSMRPPRRKVKSDIEDSGGSDTEEKQEHIINKLKKSRKKLEEKLETTERTRSLSRCEIKTPIMEETESAMEAAGEVLYSGDSLLQSGFGATKSSLLRLQTTRKKLHLDDAIADEQTVPNIKKPQFSNNGFSDLKNKSYSEQNLHFDSFPIGAIEDFNGSFKSLQPTPVTKRKFVKLKETPTEIDIYDSIRSKSSMSTSASSKHTETESSRRSRRNSVSGDAVSARYRMEQRKKSRSQPERTREQFPNKTVQSATLKKEIKKEFEDKRTSGQSRYMEWYKTKREERERQKAMEKEDERMKLIKPKRNSISKQQDDPKIQRKTPELRSKSRQDDSKGAIPKTIDTKHGQTEYTPFKRPTQTLLASGQRGKSPFKEVREETNPTRGLEDDMDSGIAMSHMIPGSQKLKRKNQNLMEKKSVFTIVYDDMQTKQLRLDSASPP